MKKWVIKCLIRTVDVLSTMIINFFTIKNEFDCFFCKKISIQVTNKACMLLPLQILQFSKKSVKTTHKESLEDAGVNVIISVKGYISLY